MDHGLWVPNGPAIPQDLIDLTISNPDTPINHPLLHLYGIVDATGQVNEKTLQTIQSALMQLFEVCNHHAQLNVA